MKGLQNLRKATPLLILGILAAIGLASAALLSYYGQAVGTATVNQSVQLDGTMCAPTQEDPFNGCTVTHTATGVAGDVIWSDADDSTDGNQPHTLENTATQAQAEVDISSTWDGSEIINVTYYAAGTDELCGTEDDVLLADEDENREGFQLILGPQDEVLLCIAYQTAINTATGEYTVTTIISPVIPPPVGEGSLIIEGSY